MNFHRWKSTRKGQLGCVGCKLRVYEKRAVGRNGPGWQVWAAWPDGVVRQIGRGRVGSTRRLAGVSACPVVPLDPVVFDRELAQLEGTFVERRGGDRWRGRSRSAKAVRLVLEQQLSQSEAARRVGLRPQAVSLALKRHRQRFQRKAGVT